MACYDKASRPCASGPMPGAVALKDGILAKWPKARSGGIFNCRPVNHPGGGNTPSVHGNGRAIDIMCDLATGHAIRSKLCTVAGLLGVQFVIHDRMKYGCEWGFTAKNYGGYDHRDHVHIELTINAGRALTRKQVDAALGNAGTDPTSPDWSDMATKEELKAAFKEALDEYRFNYGSDTDPDKLRDADWNDVVGETRAFARQAKDKP